MAKKSIRELLSAPDFEDDEKNRIAMLVYLVGLVCSLAPPWRGLGLWHACNSRSIWSSCLRHWLERLESETVSRPDTPAETGRR